MKMLGLVCCTLIGMAGSLGAPRAARAQAITPLLSTYDSSKTVTRTGLITDLTWANTHCVLFVDAKGDDGKNTNLAIELTNPRTLIMLNVIPPVVLLPGAPITVSFSPSTESPNKGLVKTLSMNGKVIFDASHIQAEIDDQYDYKPKKATPKKK